MRPTTIPAGRHHSIPRCMNDFLAELEVHPGIREVRGCRFIRSQYSRDFEKTIQLYDEPTSVLRIKAHYKGFIGYFNLRINHEQRDDVANFIDNYKPNNGNNGQQH